MCFNYRESWPNNLNEVIIEITTGLNNCIENLTGKTIHNVNNFDQWKKMFLKKISLKIEKLKTIVKRSLTKPILYELDFVDYLEIFLQKYVNVPIEKASNNFLLICKNIYISETYIKHPIHFF